MNEWAVFCMNGQFDIGDLSPPKLFVAISAVLGLLIALITEPPGKQLWHIVHWQLQTTGIVVSILITHVVLVTRLTHYLPNPWLRIAVSGFTGALLFSPVGYLSDIYLAGEYPATEPGPELLDEAFGIIPPALLAWLAMNSPWLLGYRLLRKPGNEGVRKRSETILTQERSPTEPEFLSLTNDIKVMQILYLKSELHYISIVTATDKRLILYSLKDAILELQKAEIEGIRCHRGYWVATSAIVAAKQTGRQAILELKNGEQIPVSRANVKRCLKMKAAL